MTDGPGRKSFKINPEEEEKEVAKKKGLQPQQHKLGSPWCWNISMGDNFYQADHGLALPNKKMAHSAVLGVGTFQWVTTLPGGP